MDWTGLNAKTTARSSLCVCESSVYYLVLFCLWSCNFGQFGSSVGAWWWWWLRVEQWSVSIAHSHVNRVELRWRRRRRRRNSCCAVRRLCVDCGRQRIQSLTASVPLRPLLLVYCIYKYTLCFLMLLLLLPLFNAMQGQFHATVEVAYI